MDSYACPDQSRGKRAKLNNFSCKKSQLHAIFWEMAQLVSTVVETDLKAPFLWPHHSYMKTWIQLETTYKPPQGPHVFSKVQFVTFEPANSEAIGDIHRVSNSVFSVSSYILVLRLISFQKMTEMNGPCWLRHFQFWQHFEFDKNLIGQNLSVFWVIFFGQTIPQLSNLWWMPNSVCMGFDTVTKTGSSRQFKRYPTTYMWG